MCAGKEFWRGKNNSHSNYSIFLSSVFLLLYYLAVRCIGDFSLYNLTDPKICETFPIVSETLVVSQNATIPVVRRNLMHWYKEIIIIESYASSFTSFGVSFKFIFHKNQIILILWISITAT